MSQFEEKDFSDQGFNLKTWKVILKYLKPFYKFILILIVAQLLLAASDVCIPLLNSYVIDHYQTTLASNNGILLYALVYISIIALTVILNYAFIYFAGKTEMGYGQYLRDLCFKKLHSLSFSYYDVTPTGWLLARLTSDISRLAEIIAWSMMDVIWGVPVMILTTVIMFKTNVTLAWLVIAIIPVVLVVTYFFETRLLESYRKVRKANSKITNDFSEGINGAKTTKTLVLEDYNTNEFVKDTQSMRHISVNAARLSGTFRPLMNLIVSMSLALIIYLGTDYGLKGTISFGTLVLFIQYAQQFYDPIRSLSMIITDFQMAQASAERIVQLLQQEPTIVDNKETIKKYGTVFEPKQENYISLKGNVEFKNVNFSYVEGETVLNNFNLKVNAGSTIALVGETGSGKSTIVNLICRFYEPTSGQILMDGQDYRNYSLAGLHSQLGYVLQAPHLFSGTVMENVRFGRLDATDQEVIDACKMINAHDFIMKLDKGYDSDVGEGGSRLSTGQKQLISFARAILAHPAIFILDEATSSIDTETEKIIQYAIENIMKDKTSFVVAHRLSTIVNADRILVIDKGKIIEDGNHAQLMALKGRYYQLYTNQFNQSLIHESMNSSVIA